MFERYFKKYVTAREFVESWDKEIYELTNLDYFIYLMVNHLGNQLEKRFFIQEKKSSQLNLNFENIGTVCFNIGDSFEYYLEEDCFGYNSVDYRFDLDKRNDTLEKEDGLVHKRIKMLISFLSEGLLTEQNFRVDLMEHVILDTLLQFYYEEVGIEFGEDDLEIIEMADFIEDIILDFIINESKSLLQHSADPAIDSFEQQLESEEDYTLEDDWDYKDDNIYQMDDQWDEPLFQNESLTDTIHNFIDDCSHHPSGNVQNISKEITLFGTFLSDKANVNNLYELSEEHFMEFLSVWLVQRLAQEENPKVTKIFQTMARFVSWLKNNYNIDFKHSFLKYYEYVKTDIPRVVRLLNTYLKEYDLFNVLLLRGHPDSYQISGFYEVTELRNRTQKILDLENLQFLNPIENIRLNSSIYSKLKPGDILQATLIQRESTWEVLEIHYIYPKVSKPFVN